MRHGVLKDATSFDVIEPYDRVLLGRVPRLPIISSELSHLVCFFHYLESHPDPLFPINDSDLYLSMP